MSGRVALLLLLVGACDGIPTEPPVGGPAPPSSRVDSVVAAKPKDPLADFCEVRPEGPSAPVFHYPPLDDAAPPASDRWTWVNVWATWCGPCVEELPRVVEWEAKLQADLGPGAVRFLSVDGKAEEVAAFRSKHPTTPQSARMKDLSSLEPFLHSIGLDTTAALPLQVFLDAESKVRCVRVGAVSERDYPRVKSALSIR